MDKRQELIEKAKYAAKKLGSKTLTRAEFTRVTGISGHQIYQHFDGWRQLCELAGLHPHMKNVRLGDDDLYSAMRDAFVELGGITSRTKFSRAFRYSADVFKKRGLTWPAALAEFRHWCQVNDTDFPFLGDLPKNEPADNLPKRGNSLAQESEHAAWVPATGNVYGDFLNFRGLQHTPVNEQGVVFLFGMVAHELGYAVESVQTGYPDCEAKRRISGNRWERVRIEFEYKSRSFRDHGHDPNGCDVVVCWEHNYAECPVEVLELREAIKHLPTDKRT